MSKSRGIDHVAFTDYQRHIHGPYLLCFCERGVDVFHVKTSSALYAEYEVPKVAEGFCRVDCGLKVGFNDFK